MLLDADIEEQTRKLLGHAFRGQLEEMVRLADSLGDERYLGCLRWCVLITGYIGIDVSGGWPTEADLREIARHAADTETIELDQSAVFDYLSRLVFGTETLDEVFPDVEVAAVIPVLATGRIIVSFRPQEVRDKRWYEYLDIIVGGYEVAARLNPAVLPALMYRIRRKLALQGEQVSK
jgi:hypothetical protein